MLTMDSRSASLPIWNMDRLAGISEFHSPSAAASFIGWVSAMRCPCMCPKIMVPRTATAATARPKRMEARNNSRPSERARSMRSSR